jgi:hypothetical protein
MFRMIAVVFAGLLGSVSVVAADGGPDFFAVTGLGPQDVLVLMSSPSAKASELGYIPHHARGLQNMGCQGSPSYSAWAKMTASQREKSRKQAWCKVRWQGAEGWVAARFLREDSWSEQDVDQKFEP